MTRIAIGALSVAKPLYECITNQALPGTGIDPEQFWTSLETLVRDLTPTNQALLAKRQELQDAIDAWHRERRGAAHDRVAYARFLRDIGYLVPPGEPFAITTADVDPEISRIAGPQLVVPATNARYALNAANARWGSLYDALYGTDTIPEDEGATRTGSYNPVRGTKVMRFAAEFLDRALPLEQGSHKDVLDYRVRQNETRAEAEMLLPGTSTGLKNPSSFVGFAPGVLLFKNNGLHLELHIDRAHTVGSTHPAGLKDVVLESAVIGSPDEKWGELVTAFVVVKADKEKPGEQELIDFCAHKGLTRYKLPKKIRFIASLPKNENGKIRKKDLKPL